MQKQRRLTVPGILPCWPLSMMDRCVTGARLESRCKSEKRGLSRASRPGLKEIGGTCGVGGGVGQSHIIASMVNGHSNTRQHHTREQFLGSGTQRRTNLEAVMMLN